MNIEITDECFGCFHCEYQEECVKHQDDDDDFVPYCTDSDYEDI